MLWFDHFHEAGAQTAQVKVKNNHGQHFQAIRPDSKRMPPRPFFPVEAGKLIPKAEGKIRAASERAASREFGSK